MGCFGIHCLTQIVTQLKIYYRYWVQPPMNSLPFPRFSLSSIIRTSVVFSLSRPLQRALPCHYFTPTPTVLITASPTPHNAVIAPDQKPLTSLSSPLVTILSLHYSAKPPTHCSSLLHGSAYLPSINFWNNPLY